MESSNKNLNEKPQMDAKFIYDYEFETKPTLKSSNSLTENQTTHIIQLQDLPTPSQNVIDSTCKICKNIGFSHLQNYFNIEKSECSFSGPTTNAFFDSFFLAYTLHGELVLSPDDIWLQISSNIGRYIYKYENKFRNKIVSTMVRNVWRWSIHLIMPNVNHHLKTISNWKFL